MTHRQKHTHRHTQASTVQKHYSNQAVSFSLLPSSAAAAASLTITSTTQRYRRAESTMRQSARGSATEWRIGRADRTRTDRIGLRRSVRQAMTWRGQERMTSSSTDWSMNDRRWMAPSRQSHSTVVYSRTRVHILWTWTRTWTRTWHRPLWPLCRWRDWRGDALRGTGSAVCK